MSTLASIRKPGRLRAFLLLSAAMIAATASVAGYLVGVFFEDHLFVHEEGEIVAMVRSQAQQHLAPSVFERPGEPVSALMFASFLEGLPGIFRVKAFDPLGTIVWSNEARLVGRRFAENPSLARALDGEVATALGVPIKPEHIYERNVGYVGEVYVPIWFKESRRLAGVIEVYKDMASVVRDVRRTQWRIWGVTAGMGVVLWAAIALVVWKASVGELRAIRALEEHNRELRLLYEFNRSVLRPLDLGHVAENVVEGAGPGLALTCAQIYRVHRTDSAVLLAAWPSEGGDEAPRADLIGEAVSAHRYVVSGADIAMPCVTSKGVTHVFVGRSSVPLHADSATIRTLEMMLHQAAVALTNLELFREIREAHERLAAILAGIADRMVIVDRAMRVVWTNAVGGETNGPGGEMLGTACFEALAGGPEVCGDCPAIRTFRSGHVERGVRAGAGERGRTLYMDLVTAPLRDASGEVSHVLEVARDITELVEMDERLKDVNRALRDAQAELVKKERLAAVGEMVVGLHHAILNPLSGVLGALAVLKVDGVSQCQKTRALVDAEAEIRRIERLIRQLPELRDTKTVPYVGEATMLDLERAVDITPDRGV